MARTRSVRGEVPTSHSESWLRDMTPIKRRHRRRGHGAPGSNAKIHISGSGRGWKGQRHIWHINRKMIRDPRHGMRIIILHTIMKIGRIRPHEMSECHGGGSDKCRSQMESTIDDNGNLRHDIKSQRSTDNQRSHQK